MRVGDRFALATLWLAAACRPTAPSTPEAASSPPPPVVRKPAPAAKAEPSVSLELVVPPLPLWTDRYALAGDEPPVFFNISRLMARYGLSRAEAVEVQNQVRDLGAASPSVALDDALDRAVLRVKGGVFEPPRRSDVLEAASFIVVFDLDDTLYDQYYDAKRAETCSDVEVPRDRASRRIKLTPGWETAFDRIRGLGGAIVLFSANLDEPTRRNLAHWKYEEKPLLEHPAIAAVMTNSHLVRQERSEGPGADDPQRGRPVLEPSKDLRVFDETLQRVIIVDDNPLRLFQFRNTRLVPKFDADAYCAASSKRDRALADAMLPIVVKEIEDAVAYSRKQSVPFATAFLPYSVLGRLAVDTLEASGMSRKAAIKWVREHPEHVPAEF